MRRRYKGRLSTIDYRRLTTKRGQSLIEVLIAFTVSVVIGMALVSAGLATQRASISARNKSQATKLAQQYLEEIRLMRDVKGFSGPAGYSGGWQSLCWKINKIASLTDPSLWTLQIVYISQANCDNLNSPGVGVVGATANDMTTLNGVIFYRRLGLYALTSASTKVTVKVMWEEGTNKRNVTAETVLSKWCEGSVTGTPVAGVCP